MQERPGEDLNSRLVRLINTAPVMLFMKGSPEAPQCGFSAKIVKILNEAGVKYGHFNILTDETVRQGLKVTKIIFQTFSVFDLELMNDSFCADLLKLADVSPIIFERKVDWWFGYCHRALQSNSI